MEILKIEDLTISFKTKNGLVHAVNGVDLNLEEGELLGLVGESGCGKTTTSLAIPKLLPDNSVIERGHIFFDGEDLVEKNEKEMNQIRWKEIAVIFQGAMNAFDPLYTIGKQIMEPIRLHDKKINAEEAAKKARELLEQVGISAKRFTGYPHEFSGGMRQRAMIAMALACEPRLVIADEPVTALDVMIQAQILELLKDLSLGYNLSMIMVSHDLSVLADLCDKIAVMYAGSVVEYGKSNEVFSDPRHPYTKRLMESYPNIYEKKEFVHGIPGYPPNMIDPPKGCLFYERCPDRSDECKAWEPEEYEVSEDRKVSCIMYNEVKKGK